HSALPPGARDDIARVAERFLLDAPGWAHRDDPGEVLQVVADAVWRGRRLDLRYGRGGRPVRRRVDPLGLGLDAGAWHPAAAPRPEPAWRPPGFDLARWWSASATAFDASIRPLPARLRLSPVAARRLPRLVPGELTVRALERGEVDDDGWVTVDVPLEPVEVAVSQLAPLPGVEVLAPQELRAAL